jgi:NCAIR mutase (PurE)-related protein
MTSEWKSDPFQDLRAALEGEELSGRTNPGVWVDPTRRRRTGVPEIVLAEGKTIEQLLAAIDLLLEREGRVLVSRVQPAQFEAICTRFVSVPVRTAPSKRTLVLRARRVRCPAHWWTDRYLDGRSS